MGNITAYIILIIAVALGTAANGFAKAANGFTIFLLYFAVAYQHLDDFIPPHSLTSRT